MTPYERCEQILHQFSSMTLSELEGGTADTLRDEAAPLWIQLTHEEKKKLNQLSMSLQHNDEK